MATATLLAKARQRRINALASLETRRSRTDNVVSIFDFAFDDQPRIEVTAPTSVIAFHSCRTTAANEDRVVDRAA